MFRISAALIILVFVTAPHARAEMGPGRAMVSLGGSYFGGEFTSTDNFVDGAALNVALDIMHPVSPISFLVAFSWGQMTTQDPEFGSQVERTLRTWPTFLGGRYWLGSQRVKLSLGLGLGVWFASLDRVVDDIVESTTHGEGFGLAVPVGTSLSITRGTNLNVGYTLHVLTDNSVLQNNLLHSVNVGLGFSWGN